MKFLKNAVFLTLFSLFPLLVYSQATADELLDGYVSASANKENATPYITKINQVFKNYNNIQQAAFRGKIYEKINGDTIIEQQRLAKKMALIDLYALLAESNDSKLDDLYFQKGEICGLHTGDTIMLKECITGLKLSDQSKTPKVTDYITTLQDYLEQICNYLPLSKRLDGIWVSDYMINAKWNYPAFVLNVDEFKIKLELGYAFNYSAQSVIDIGKDKVYMVWSNEKLKIPNQAVALSLGQTIGDITTDAVTEATSSLIGNIGGDIIGGIAGNVIGNAIMDIFAPSKTIYVLEMELEQKNEYELQGKFYLQTIIIDGKGNKEIKKEEDKVSFMKYDIESGVYFYYSDNTLKYIPGYGIQKFFPQNHTQIFDNNQERYLKSIIKSRSHYFGLHQMKKLIYFTEQRLFQKGYVQEKLIYKNLKTKTALLGIYFYNVSGNKKKLTKGVYVHNVEKNNCWLSHAYMFGINKGDILLSIDGYEMESPEQCEKYIQSLKPYDWINVHIKRDNKEMDMQVELTWFI